MRRLWPRRRLPTVRQQDLSDCGAACLAAVAAYYGLHVPITRIRQYASTDQYGTTMVGMIEAARRLGLTAKGVRATRDGLLGAPKPAIVQTSSDEGRLLHFVVVYEAAADHLTVMDPLTGELGRTSWEALPWTGVVLVLSPAEQFTPGDERASVLRRFWTLLRPHRTTLAEAFVGALAYTLLGLGTAVYVQKLVDYVLADGNGRLLNLMSVAMIAALLAQAYLGVSKSFLTLYTGQKIDAELVLGYYRHLLRLPQQFFDTMRVGEILSRMNDAVKIRSFINDVALELMVNVLVVTFSVGLMFVYSWKLALLVLVLIPAYGGIYAAANAVNRRTQRRMMEKSAELEAQVVEALGAVPTIKRFGIERFAHGRVEVAFVRLLGSVYQSARASVLTGGATELTGRLFTVVLLWVGAGFVLRREMSAGELMSCYALVGYLTGPIASLITMNRTMQDALIAADRLFDVLHLEQEAGSETMALAAVPADVRFEDVTFRYGSRPPVFRRLNLSFPRGRMTAVVGESGSGKTTLATLVQRLYTAQEGRVMIGDQDVRHVSLESLRRVTAIVPQQIDLLSGTIMDNIAVGEYQPDTQRVLEISRELGILEFVQDTPDGFDSRVGTNGVILSGGQRQRIAIARALYRDPQILILDEATSALDPHSEQYVQRVMQRLRQEGKTVIVIAHRLSTVMQADRIVVLERGQLVETGTHAELMARRGHYHGLWASQFPGLALAADGVMAGLPVAFGAPATHGNGNGNGNGAGSHPGGSRVVVG